MFLKSYPSQPNIPFANAQQPLLLNPGQNTSTTPLLFQCNSQSNTGRHWRALYTCPKHIFHIRKQNPPCPGCQGIAHSTISLPFLQSLGHQVPWHHKSCCRTEARAVQLLLFIAAENHLLAFTDHVGCSQSGLVTGHPGLEVVLASRATSAPTSTKHSTDKAQSTFIRFGSSPLNPPGNRAIGHNSPAAVGQEAQAVGFTVHTSGVKHNLVFKERVCHNTGMFCPEALKENPTATKGKS